MKNVIDITLPLCPDVPVFPGDPSPTVELLSSIAQGDRLTASKLELAAHVGTHVDLPAHFVKDGKILGDYAVERFLGPAWVLDLSDVQTEIRPDRLAGEAIPEKRHLLLKTRNSPLLQDPKFREDYVHLAEDAARYLLAHRPLSIGFDYYSLDPADSTSFAAHRQCAEADLPVFVCLALRHVPAGDCWFAGLPLQVPQLEGAPVRAIIWHA
ncbi:cyclase family protein [Fodinicurvata halophila]|uniref:Cyclase family protein n=1 Tax=Fodinicurvata halophila TaxID=1419723 RepID=A0ABV8ULN9_9PROT